MNNSDVLFVAKQQRCNIIIGYEFSISLSGTGADTEKVYEMMRALINENTQI